MFCLVSLVVFAVAVSARPDSITIAPGISQRLETPELQRFFGVENHEDAPAYEIVYPEVITQDRTFTITTEAIPADSLQLSVDAFGETVHMTLHHDDANISPDLNMIEIRDGGEFSVAVRTDCLYSGFVKSEPESLVSAETSNGLTAIIYYGKGSLVIQPLTGEQAKKRDMGRGHPHIAYRGNNNDIVCAVDDTIQRTSSSDSISSKVQSVKYLELALYYDYQAWQKIGNAIFTEYLTLFTTVKGVLQKSSLVGSDLVVKLVKARYFAVETAFKTSVDISQTLRTARDYLFTRNAPASDPTHFDNVALVSGHPVSGSTGIAYLSQCGQKYAVSVSKYQSLSSVAGTMCHEIGHNLGMYHDTSGCGSGKYIMYPSFDANKASWGWSQCSRTYYQNFVSTVTCYDDA